MVSLASFKHNATTSWSYWEKIWAWCLQKGETIHLGFSVIVGAERLEKHKYQWI
jgi:hypothetical protein